MAENRNIASSLNTLFAGNLSSSDNEALSIFIEEYLCPQEDQETLEGETFFLTIITIKIIFKNLIIQLMEM